MSKTVCDELLYPVDIGAWASYEAYSDPEQLDLQEKNFFPTGLKNGAGEISLIYTKQIARLHDYLENSANKVKLKDTETVIEDEVFYTATIEGAKTTRVRTSELHNGSPIRPDNEKSERMVKNGFEAVKLLNLYGGKIDEEKLIAVWNVLIDGCCENESARGERYRGDVIFAGPHEGADSAIVPELMKQWISFYNSEKYDEKPFLKASLMHFAFETIHPFCDGNGRLGRLLINNYLISRNIESARAVSFSMAINQKRSAYDAAFVAGENKKNDCTPFVTFMLEVMADAYATALERNSKGHGTPTNADSRQAFLEDIKDQVRDVKSEIPLKQREHHVPPKLREEIIRNAPVLGKADQKQSTIGEITKP